MSGAEFQESAAGTLGNIAVHFLAMPAFILVTFRILMKGKDLDVSFAQFISHCLDDAAIIISIFTTVTDHHD